jgi:hypothetical protein
MPKRTGKKQGRKDTNQLARAVMERIEAIAEEQPEKNPAAVELGRRGGLKGGRARMDSLSPQERRKLAEKAAKARWGK